MIRTIALMSSLVTMTGCVSLSGPKTRSGWIALARAESADCAAWPLRPKDLRIDEVAVTTGTPPAYLASGVRRDGGALFIYAPFPGEPELEAKDLVNLSLGRGSLLAGGGVLGKQMLVAVVQNSAQKSWLELRDPRSNLVKHQLELRQRGVRDVRFAADATAMWLAYQSDDGATGLVRVQAVKGGKFTAMETTLAGGWRDPLTLVPLERGELLVARRDEKASGVLQFTRIAASGQVAAEARLDMQLGGELESWSVANLGGSLHLAWVEGDSLIGQATLKVAAVTLGGPAATLAWMQKTPLKDVHVNEPLLRGAPGRVEVLSLQWIDEESTVAAYAVSAGAIGKPTYHGIFPKGSRIIANFRANGGEDQYVLVRHKVDALWAFRICRL